MEKDDLEIGDVESYGGFKEQAFSHQALVMMATKKCIEYGTQEQVQGVYVSEKDRKGNTKIIYKQDTRRAFIESVRTLKMIMICDFDNTAEENIKKLLDKAERRKKELIAEQNRWFESLTSQQKNNLIQKGVIIMKDSFSTQLPFIQTYLFEELEIYRKIFEELTLLTERKDFYKEEMFEA